MATRTRNQLRNLVRTQLDLDVIELPDAVVDGWLEDAFERSLAIEDCWPFFEAEWNVTTVSGQVPYTKAAIAVANANVAIDQIVSVADITTTTAVFELLPLSHDAAKAAFGLGGVAGNVPAYWSEWASSVHVWPSPGVRSLRIYGYRKPSWVAGDAIAPDCDERLHLCLWFFAAAMAYDQQEDEALSAEYLKHWQAALTQAHAKIVAQPQHRPIIMSRGSCL